MSVIYWLELGKALASGFALALPTMALMIFFHNKRGERFDQIKADLKKMDTDIDGLTKQLSESEAQAREKFLTRNEHIGAINRLDATLIELNRQITNFNTNLFNLARGAHRDPHDIGN